MHICMYVCMSIQRTKDPATNNSKEYISRGLEFFLYLKKNFEECIIPNWNGGLLAIVRLMFAN